MRQGRFHRTRSAADRPEPSANCCQRISDSTDGPNLGRWPRQLLRAGPWSPLRARSRAPCAPRRSRLRRRPASPGRADARLQPSQALEPQRGDRGGCGGSHVGYVPCLQTPQVTLDGLGNQNGPPIGYLSGGPCTHQIAIRAPPRGSGNLNKNVFRGLSPYEWPGVTAQLSDPLAELRLQFDDAMVGRPLGGVAGKLGEPALSQAEPG